MANTTKDAVRRLTGVTTSQISDTILDDIIALADKQVDNEPEVKLSTDEKDIASANLAAAITLRRLAQEAMINSGSYSLGRLRVDNRSTAVARLSLAESFEKKYRQIISMAADGTGVRKIWLNP
jgi:predicted Zn-dependent protease